MKMIKKKHGLRIATFFSILMLLLIPLLSQPVAADVCFDVGSMWATTPGPSAGGDAIDNEADDDESGKVKFSVAYSFNDEGSLSGSIYTASMTIYKQVTGFPSKTVSVQENLEPNEGPIEGRLNLEDTYTQAELPVTWKVDILITVWDNGLSAGDSWTPQNFLDLTINA